MPRRSGVSREEVRALALSIAGALEKDHHGIPSFRTKKRIFATLPDGPRLHVMLTPEATEEVLATFPACTETLHWGRQIAGVRVDLEKASASQVARLLALAAARP